MATIRSSTSVSLQLEPNIKDLIGWFKHLRTKKHFKNVKSEFEKSQNKAEMQSAVRGIIQTRIYDVWPDPGTRTYDLLNSFLVDSESGERPNLAIYSDPDIASAKYYPDLSYAAFFEEPVEFSTFITPRGTSYPPRNHRPFFSALEGYAESVVPEKARDAFLQAAFDEMPPSIEGILK